MTLLSGGPVYADDHTETTVQAAVVHKIAKFVSWPDDAFESVSAPMQFCVSGDARMLDAISALASERVHGRLITPVDVQSPADAIGNCDVLVFGDGSSGDPQEWADAVAERPVLTFATDGGYGVENSIVRVLIRRNKVSFEINLNANENTGLRIGGRLLQLAAVVGGRDG